VAVDITIHKRVWLAAGLGGGSSDAAAVLRGLAGLLGPLPGDALQRVARELGADVPFFLEPRPARATGIGDRLEPLAGLPALQLVLANPGRPLSTARVFGALGAPPSAGWRPPARIHGANLLELVHNDLISAARRLCPGLDRLEAAMRQHPGVEAVGLTGSGPTLFGVCDGLASAARLAEHLAETTGFSAQITRTVAA
jgi:4-diphosphocytidyl-2-C-methyl-D-erythritol kinase